MSYDANIKNLKMVVEFQKKYYECIKEKKIEEPE